MKDKIIPVVAVLALLLGVWTWWTMPKAPATGLVGATSGMHLEDYLPYVRSNGGTYTELPIRIGANGTDVSQLQKGTCSLIMPSFSLVASTSVTADCAITGVTSTDVVFAQFATTTANTNGPGWLVVGANASTTAGFITLSISNLTGATAIIPASVASTTKYLILR